MKTINQAAATLGLSRTRITTLIRSGQLDTRPNPYRVGGVLITEAAIAARLKAKKRWLQTRRAESRQEEETNHVD